MRESVNQPGHGSLKAVGIGDAGNTKDCTILKLTTALTLTLITACSPALAGSELCNASRSLAETVVTARVSGATRELMQILLDGTSFGAGEYKDLATTIVNGAYAIPNPTQESAVSFGALIYDTCERM